jgi:uncharacterized protein YuzE
MKHRESSQSERTDGPERASRPKHGLTFFTCTKRHAFSRPTLICSGRLPMTFHIGPYEFDHVSYDSEVDVLYLRRGKGQAGAGTSSTPEGHAVRLGADGDLISITIFNAKWLLERDGRITVTVPRLIETNTDDLTEALTTA